MLNFTINRFKKYLDDILNGSFKGEPVNIVTDEGNYVLITEEEYNSLLETVEIDNDPILSKQLLEASSEIIKDSAEFVKFDEKGL